MDGFVESHFDTLENPYSRWGGADTVFLEREDELAISKHVVLQALYRVRFPVNVKIELISFEHGPGRVTQAFNDPRRFVAWACREGFVPREFLRDCQRYARGL